MNSINWARVLAQTVYYFTAAVALGAPGRKVSFAVPTGNFGDVFAGYVAKRMGLPIERLVIATNQNDILHRTLESGAHRRAAVAPSVSPSMDIQVSSNFERLLFELYDREGPAVAALMGELAQGGGFSLSQGALGRLRGEFDSARASEAETLAAIARDLPRQRARWSVRIPRWGSMRQGCGAAIRRCRWWCWRRRIRRSSRTRSRRPAGCARRCRRGSPS